jgi:sucrose-6-phosphate hydrolase SacC (GH32 family)
VQSFWLAVKDARIVSEGEDQNSWFGGRSWAAQTWNEIPLEDGRRIQTSFMGDKFPGMAFASIMTFPTELTLRTTADGIRLYSWPVKEIAQLIEWKRDWHDLTVRPGENPLEGISGDVFDITAEFAVPPQEPAAPEGAGPKFGFVIGDVTLDYDPSTHNLCCQGNCLPLPPANNAVRVRILVDQGVLEIFGNDGARCMVTHRGPSDPDHALAVFAKGQPVRIPFLEVCQLKTIWPAQGTEGVS